MIINNYNSTEHATFLLQNPSVSSSRSFKNRFLIFHDKLNAIINVRNTEETDLDSIWDECINCSKDIEDIITLNKKYLKRSEIILIGIVAAPKVIAEDICTNLFDNVSYLCGECTPRILTRKELLGDESLKVLQTVVST